MPTRGSSKNIPQTAYENNLFGIKPYRYFYEAHLRDLIAEKRSEAIASVCFWKDSYRLFHVIDVYREGKPVDRRLLRANTSLKKLLKEALRKGHALLLRGIFAIPKEAWEEYKRNYRTANRFEIFKLDRLTQLAPHILIDLDGISFEDLKRVVKYLHELGIYPEVWESASGEGNYHIYIKLVGRVARWKEKQVDEETGEEFEVERKLYYLPYASDYRIKLAIEGVKEVFRRLGVKYDSISSTRAVWMEGIPNPEKGGKASRKIWNGKLHRIDTLTEKLRPLWEKTIREKAREEYFSFLRRRQSPKVGTCEVVSDEHSNPIDYLQENISATFRMLDKGYTWAEIERELRAEWRGDERAFERAFAGFREWVEAHYKPLTGQNPRRKAKPKEERKHKHYWEHVPTIRQVLLEDGIDSSLNHIHRKTGIAKGTLSYIFRIVSREQILKSPEEAQELLRTYQKGGDRLSKEQKEALRQRQKEKWERYLDEFLTKAIQKRKKSLGDNEEKGLYVREEGFTTLKGVLITLPPSEQVKGVQKGSLSITPPSLREERRVEDGKHRTSHQTPSLPTRPDSSSLSSPDSSSPSPSESGKEEGKRQKGFPRSHTGKVKPAVDGEEREGSRKEEAKGKTKIQGAEQEAGMNLPPEPDEQNGNRIQGTLPKNRLGLGENGNRKKPPRMESGSGDGSSETLPEAFDRKAMARMILGDLLNLPKARLETLLSIVRRAWREPLRWSKSLGIDTETLRMWLFVLEEVLEEVVEEDSHPNGQKQPPPEENPEDWLDF